MVGKITVDTLHTVPRVIFYSKRIRLLFFFRACHSKYTKQIKTRTVSRNRLWPQIKKNIDHELWFYFLSFFPSTENSWFGHNKFVPESKFKYQLPWLIGHVSTLTCSESISLTTFVSSWFKARLFFLLSIWDFPILLCFAY